MNRPFDILLIGGASGVGKSNISYELAKLYDVNVVQVDDFQCIVEHFTREEDYPVFHYWNNHFEEAVAQPLEKKLEIMVSYANAMAKALELVINNHLEEGRPMILEGDFIAPALCKMLLEDSRTKDRVKAIIVTEDDLSQIISNYHVREGTIQEGRSALSLRYNDWLKAQVQGTGVLMVTARPWDTAAQRIKALLK